ncbi:Dual specificity protein phosphatase 16, partial [Stegodyphus mimosarum]
MKRRLQQEKISIEDFLAQNCHWEVDRSIDIIVYDQNTRDAKCLPPDSFMAVFLQKLLPVYNSVNILKGGFLEFQAAYPHLCEDEGTKYAPLTSLSQPCLPVTNHGPTKILPFLYLGSQHDALNQEILQHYNITYQLNVSTTCPKPDFIQESHFLRIPVIDNYSEKLLPHFPKAFQFLDKVKESGGSVLVHCLAGISRSATVAIAYVMKTLKMSSDEAYRYVKAKRATISPNFNFLGQLLEYEKQLLRECVLDFKSESAVTPMFNSSSPSFEQRCKNKAVSHKMIDTTIMCSQQLDRDCIVKYTDLAELTFPKGISQSVETVKTKQCSSAFEKSTYKNGDVYNYVSNKEPGTFSIKCLAVSSLKELNFTPCQTSAFKTSQCLKGDKNNIKAPKVPSCGSLPNKMESSNFANSYPCLKLDKKMDSSYNEILLSECKMETLRNLSSLSPDYHSADLKSFEFDSKSYNRSDSVSTSGLGSEGSDCADSWNEYTSSCERETDILMDDDFSTVPAEDDEFQRNKILGFDDSYEDSLSLYPKYEPQFNNRCTHVQKYSSAASGGIDKQFSIRCGDTSKYSTENGGLKSVQNSEYEKELGGAHILYRAQSCPGMLSSESSPEASGRDKLLENNNVKLRKTRPAKSSKDKCRNRYSCSSIDYMDYSLSTGFSHESCPDVLHFSSRSESSPIPSSHCNYRHSMIQVS